MTVDWKDLLFKMLLVILGDVAKFIIPIIEDILAGSGMAQFLESLYNIVVGVEESHPELGGPAKLALVRDAAKVLRSNAAPALDDSQLNTLIEASVRRMRREQLQAAK